MSEDGDRSAFERRLRAAEDAGLGPGLGSKRDTAAKQAGSAQRAIELAMRLGVEMVAAMVIAVVIGWGLDKLFHTSPWLMIIMVPVGMAAGFRNLLRASDKN